MSCAGSIHLLKYSATKGQKAYLLADGSLATRFRMAVNADGMKRAYHRDDVAGGGLISLCNGGKAYPADRPPYNGSESKEACKQFSHDYMAIKQAGWKDPSVGAIHWFGVLGEDKVQIGDSEVTGVVSVEQSDGSGFYVSPTALADTDTFPDPKDQRRYIDAETIPAAVIRSSKALSDLGVRLGTFGVAMHLTIRKSVPFIVGDYGPRIGEGTFALARLVKGLPLVEATRKNIYSGHIAEKEVLWVFFGGEKMSPPYDQPAVTSQALEAFNAWGGESRLISCLDNTEIPVADES
jgi:hypothetical protein